MLSLTSILQLAPAVTLFSVGTPLSPRTLAKVRLGLDQLPKSFSIVLPKKPLQPSHSYAENKLRFPRDLGITWALFLNDTLGSIPPQKRQIRPLGL